MAAAQRTLLERAVVAVSSVRGPHWPLMIGNLIDASKDPRLGRVFREPPIWWGEALHEMWTAGELDRDALELGVSTAWRLVGPPPPPTDGIGYAGWTAMFRAAGYVSWPEGRWAVPTTARTLYRGATAERLAGMSWTPSIGVAREAARLTTELRGCPTFIVTATVPPSAVLATFGSRWWTQRWWTEVVVDPTMVTLGRVDPLESNRY